MNHTRVAGLIILDARMVLSADESTYVQLPQSYQFRK